jgi:hypothetical protein
MPECPDPSFGALCIFSGVCIPKSIYHWFSDTSFIVLMHIIIYYHKNQLRVSQTAVLPEQLQTRHPRHREQEPTGEHYFEILR